ncbi:MAG: RidA family protein [Syntrophales bacterium]|nr:RidA family protein [Syntrophales bacterium]
MSKRVITNAALPTIGPYSPAVAAGNLVFCSGQIPLDPKTGNIVATDIGAATKQAMENLQTVLSAAGLGFEHVVKTTIYLTNMGDFPVVNEVYGRFFTGDYPARSTVSVAALPKGAPIEIEAIAMRPDLG